MPEITVELPPSAINPRIGRAGSFAFPLLLAVIAAILAGMVLLILKMNHGVFIYSMDDPYIGLALSDQIRHGNYGLNSGMPAAPDSSILYPLLMVPASGSPLHPYLPLILNTLALFATLVIIWRFFMHLRLAQDTFGVFALAATLLLLALYVNLIGVAFTGLEHSLHIAAVAAAVYGLALFLDTDKMPRWLPAAIVVAPLLRFEGLALSLAALLVLLLRGRWRAALGSLAAIGLCMGLFSVFLIHIGMPPLPSSVLAKSEVAANGINGAGGGFFQSISENVSTMAHIPSGALLLLIGAIALARCLGEALGLRSRVAAIMNWLPRRLRNTRFFRLFAGPDAEDHDPSTIFDAQPRRWSSQGLMALLLACFIAAHAVAGQFGWLDRYEDYVLLGSALISIYLLRKAIRYVLLNRSARVVLPGAIAIILAMICYRYIRVTWRVPLASNNIYEQQFQMHRFVNDYYRGPVAVNDLGLVSYHNPNFVLDLGGLASERARILKAGDASAEDYRTLVADSGVHLVIIYEEWFPGQIPASWIKVASMNLSREHVSCALSEVQFYATDAFTASQLQPELESFRKSLPPGVKLTIHIGRGPGN